MVAVTVFAVVLGAASVEGIAMTTETTEARIERAVAAEAGWSPGEFEIQPLDKIQLPPCAFFSVAHKVRPVRGALTYAVLPDGVVLGQREKDAAARILATCAKAAGASAGSWAEVLTRFHAGVGPGTVLYDRAVAQEALEPFESSGGTFAPPSFVSGETGTAVRFFLLNSDTGSVYQVKAVRRPDGGVGVEKTKAGG